MVRKVLIPVHRCHIFFLTVTGLAAGDNVAFSTPTSLADWYDVVHGKRFGFEFLLAVITNPRLDFALPPAALP